MNDRDLLTLAYAVDVLTPETRYLAEIDRIHREHINRLGYLWSGVLLCLLLGVYVIFAVKMGAA